MSIRKMLTIGLWATSFLTAVLLAAAIDDPSLHLVDSAGSLDIRLHGGLFVDLAWIVAVLAVVDLVMAVYEMQYGILVALGASSLVLGLLFGNFMPYVLANDYATFAVACLLGMAIALMRDPLTRAKLFSRAPAVPPAEIGEHSRYDS